MPGKGRIIGTIKGEKKVGTAQARQIEKHEGVRSGFEVVTPDLATKWLEGNTHNRSVRDTVVSRYAADMQSGRWKQTHQGIAFDSNGTLIDGQHRLFAIIEADVPVLLQVTRGLPMDTQMVVDDNIQRTVVDTMKIAIDKMADLTKLHAAVSERLRFGMQPRSQGTTATRLEKAAFLQAHWEAIHFAVGCFPPKKRKRGIMTASTIAVIARAFYHEDRVQLQRFAAVLLDGISRAASEENIIVLRNWLITRRTSASDLEAIEVYAKTMRALQAFLKGEKRMRHLYAASVDPYPLPKVKK